MKTKIHHEAKQEASSWGKMMKRGLSSMGLEARDKRRFTRYECLFPVEIHVDSPGQVEVITAEAKNISSGGMLLKCSAVLDSFTRCHVSFQIPEWFPGASRAVEIMAAATILHASASGLTCGIAFSQPL